MGLVPLGSMKRLALWPLHCCQRVQPLDSLLGDKSSGGGVSWRRWVALECYNKKKTKRVMQ